MTADALLRVFPLIERVRVTRSTGTRVERRRLISVDVEWEAMPKRYRTRAGEAQKRAGQSLQATRAAGGNHLFVTMFVPAGGVNTHSPESIFAGCEAPSKSNRLRLACASMMRTRRTAFASLAASMFLST